MLRLTIAVLAIVVGSSTSGLAQQPDTTAPSFYQPIIFKDPTLASTLSFMLPGAGQIYTHRPRNAVLFLTAAVAGVALATKPCRKAAPFEPQPTCYNPAIGIGVYAVSWISSIALAAEDAREYNRRLRRR